MTYIAEYSENRHPFRFIWFLKSLFPFRSHAVQPDVQNSTPNIITSTFLGITNHLVFIILV